MMHAKVHLTDLLPLMGAAGGEAGAAETEEEMKLLEKAAESGMAVTVSPCLAVAFWDSQLPSM